MLHHGSVDHHQFSTRRFPLRTFRSVRVNVNVNVLHLPGHCQISIAFSSLFQLPCVSPLFLSSCVACRTCPCSVQCRCLNFVALSVSGNSSSSFSSMSNVLTPAMLSVLDSSFKPDSSQQRLPVFLVGLVLRSVIPPCKCSTQHFNVLLIFACASQGLAHRDIAPFTHLLARTRRRCLSHAAEGPSQSGAVSVLTEVLRQFDPFFFVASGVEVRLFHEHERLRSTYPRFVLALRVLATSGGIATYR